MVRRAQSARAVVLGLAALLPVSLLGPAGPAVGTSAPRASTVATAPEAAPDTGDQQWVIRRVGPASYQVSWRSPTPFPPVSDRPTIVPSATADDEIEISSPVVRRDGRTVTATVSTDSRLTPSDLDVALSGDRLDEPGDDRLAVPGARPGETGSRPRGQRRAEELAVDPGEPGELATASSDYELDPVKLPGMREPIEMVGHVVEPAPGELAGPAPLVLFQHGKHAECYDPSVPDRVFYLDWPCQAPLADIPSHLGYDYLQQLLASQGYVTVSIRVNGINAQDGFLPDAGAGARASIIARHLDHWAGIAADHQVDLDQVVLVGHSRGGEGVDRASIRIPLAAPYRVVGQVLIAPTDFGSQTAPYVPTVTLLPYCDGDVADLQGQRFTDVARDLAEDDTSLKSSVMVLGANHNYFNTEWTPGISAAQSFDDWFGPKRKPCGTATPERLTDSEQRDVALSYVAGAVRMFTGEDDLLPMFDGSVVDVPSIGDATVLSHAIGGARDVRRASSDTDLSLTQGATTSFCVGTTRFGAQVGACGQRILGQVTPHWTFPWESTPTRRFFQMDWDAVGQRGGLLLREPLDLTGRRLELRTLVDPRLGDAELGVRLEDADGAAVEVTPQGGAVVPALPSGFAKIWAQAVLVDPADATGIDVSRVTRVDLVSRNDRGRVWVADLSAAPMTLAPVPERRMGILDLATVRIQEGDGPGQVTAQVPYEVHGLDRPARVVVVASRARLGSDRFVLDLAPGQTSGTLPATYRANTLDNLRQVAQRGYTAYVRRGVMTDSYQGRAVILDDDPTPRITARPVRRTVPEGRPQRLRVSLDSPVDYELTGFARFVSGPDPELRVNDLRAGYRTRLGIQDRPQRKLSKAGAVVPFPRIRRGDSDSVITVPTATDSRREARESLRLRVVLFTGDGRERRVATAGVARSD